MDSEQNMIQEQLSRSKGAKTGNNSILNNLMYGGRPPSENARIPVCPKCKMAYRIKVEYRFRLAWQRVLTHGTIIHLLELVMVKMMCLFMLLF